MSAAGTKCGSNGGALARDGQFSPMWLLLPERLRRRDARRPHHRHPVRGHADRQQDARQRYERERVRRLDPQHLLEKPGRQPCPDHTARHSCDQRAGPSPRIILVISPRSAPSAAQTPISFVRALVSADVRRTPGPVAIRPTQGVGSCAHPSSSPSPGSSVSRGPYDRIAGRLRRALLLRSISARPTPGRACRRGTRIPRSPPSPPTVARSEVSSCLPVTPHPLSRAAARW